MTGYSMSHPRETRLECLRLTKPDVSAPDLKAWIARAEQLEAWINAAGYADRPPHKAAPDTSPRPGQATTPQAIQRK